MAWEQILTDGTPTSKLSDVNEDGVANGDLLIYSAEVGATGYKTNVLGGDANEITITNGYGTSSVGLHDTEVVIPADLKVTTKFKLGDDIIRTNDGDASITITTANDAVTLAGTSLTLGEGAKIVDTATGGDDELTITKTNVKLAGAGEVTGDLVVGGGSTTINAGAGGEDATLTLNGGATAKSAIIALSADAGATVGDNWEVKAADGGVMTFTNDAAALNEQVAMASWTPNSTATSSKLTLAGDLHLGGDLIQFTSNEKITRSSGILAVTAASTTFSGDITVTGNDITFGNGETISNSSDNVLAITSASTTLSGDLSLKTDGDQIKFGANDEITLTHSHNAGLLLKHDASGDDKYPTLTLQTGDDNIADCDKLGVINFQAPDEGAGTDAIVVAASIHAESEGDFSASNNATTMSFSLATSGAVTERMRLSSSGHLSVDADLITTGGNIRSGYMGSSTSAIVVGSYGDDFDGTEGSDAKVYGDLIVGGGDIIYPSSGVGKISVAATPVEPAVKAIAEVDRYCPEVNLKSPLINPT